MNIDAQIVAEGLGFPEGPLLLPDGRLAFVEMYRGRVSVLEDGVVRELAYLGGSPNGLALGTDGRIYVARPEGRVGEWMSPDPQPPAIVAVDPVDGSVETVAVEAGGEKLRAPNDLCFGPDGALYFTDPCRPDPDADISGWICRVDADGCEIVHALGNVFPNGIGFDLRGGLVWAETWTHRLVGPSGTVAQLADDAYPDGFAFTTDGRCVVATVSTGALDLVDWSSGSATVDRIRWADGVTPVNVAFDGSTIWVTDVTPDWADPTTLGGRLWRLTSDLRGAPLGAG
jgi:gluconolactonase